MTLTRSKMVAGVSNPFQGSGSDIKKAPGEVPYVRETINFIECLLVSAMIW